MVARGYLPFFLFLFLSLSPASSNQGEMTKYPLITNMEREEKCSFWENIAGVDIYHIIGGGDVGDERERDGGTVFVLAFINQQQRRESNLRCSNSTVKALLMGIASNCRL